MQDERYEDLGPLGTGGMGEVRRVRDRRLGRTVALKTLRFEIMASPTARRRFVEEAQVAAQLQHPGIVPVHDYGVLPDGRAWFTMDEIHGITLQQAIEEADDDGPALRRLVGNLKMVADAVGFAHARGVLHRDLKPANVMLGPYGEVSVVDWGVARVLDHAEPDADDAIATVRHETGERTRMGVVVGTPRYMSPEQAAGAALDARADVFALGAILSLVLTRLAPASPAAVARLDEALHGRDPGIPRALAALAIRALDPEPGPRPPNGEAFSRELVAWLDGVRQEEEASAMTREALARAARVPELLARAEALEARADAMLDAIERWQPEDLRHAAWSLLDEAEALRAEARLKSVEIDLDLHAAAYVANDHADAHHALAARYLDRLLDAERVRDSDEADTLRSHMAAHVDAIPTSDPRRAGLEAALDGAGALTLVTEPPGATAVLYRYEVRHRRLHEVFVRELGATPLSGVPLPMGSYLCVLRHPDRETVRYPFEITRQRHWDGLRPGDSAPAPIWLPPRGWLGPDAVYVPAGWFRSGGDPGAPDSLPASRVWLDAFVVQRFHVTNAEHIRFLDGLVEAGRTEEALRHAPNEHTQEYLRPDTLVYGFDGRRFHLKPDLDGDLWHPEWPVFLVDWHGAAAYARWLASETGRPWRLPTELELEKAGRGVDGRWFPWGDAFDPSWASTAWSQEHDRLLPVPVQRFPVDEGPSGVRGMAGNGFQWTLDDFFAGPRIEGGLGLVPLSPPREVCVKGGTFAAPEQSARLAGRSGRDARRLNLNVSFRAVYALADIEGGLP
ncbi:MAG: SUMF1/EgtB/PvdO family nonheme iron enzyme [Alphaproteobacteria bacterium]|nr:SUMF1/EgtB/PvdO family nonheme iron enzyme [Alphaproteobacteria bacterium]